MLLADMGAALLGYQTAALIRAVALFDEGCKLELLAAVLDQDIREVADDVDRLFDIGILWPPEIDLIAVNRGSAYWPGISSLLDANILVEQALAMLGERLGGPGTRVALYGAVPVDSRQFIPRTRLVLIVPGVRSDPRISVRQEIDALADDITFTTIVHQEPLQEQQKIVKSGDAETIRRWMNADDVRALPVLDEGAHLEWACRQNEVGLATVGGAGNAKKRRPDA
ncbi:hypothetical protein [Leifsonia sp. Leaf264]|uniref:hypothetical protein n=1 Tax=Leifsonia sp. Leaf264 TaxID=1736314 RepID=UPI00070133BE|nr:hypothetical protein [Leifsonia sp. Leaf264]KQO97495.1 hypothetical protein ASF30_13770 [Leifsonia sp. Leaf264]